MERATKQTLCHPQGPKLVLNPLKPPRAAWNMSVHTSEQRRPQSKTGVAPPFLFDNVSPLSNLVRGGLRLKRGTGQMPLRKTAGQNLEKNFTTLVALNCFHLYDLLALTFYLRLHL